MILSKDELFREFLKTLCSSKILTMQEITSKFEASPTEIEVLLSVLIGEGILLRINAGTLCHCAKCPLRNICSIKEINENNVASINYYRLSNSGLKLCEELQKQLNSSTSLAKSEKLPRNP